MVRAKFRVHYKKVHDWGTEVQLHPVYSNDPNHENKRFWDATPSGAVNMTIKNSAAAELFKEDKEYYVDFTLVETPAVEPSNPSEPAKAETES